MSRTIRAILLIAALAIGGGFIAVTAYQAGLASAITTAVAEGATVVAPLPVYGYGYGWHPGGFGFGIFGFLGTLLFLFLFFGLIRAIFFRGGPSGHGGWGRHAAWDRHGAWQRDCPPASSDEPPSSNPGSKPA